MNSAASCSFPATDVGWVIGIDGEIFHTENGGYVGIEDDDDHIFDDNLSEKSNLSIYPNPASAFTELAFSFHGNSPVRINLYQADGRLVFTEYLQGVNKEKYSYKLNTMGLIPGIYLVEVCSGDQLMTGKLLIKSE